MIQSLNIKDCDLLIEELKVISHNKIRSKEYETAQKGLDINVLIHKIVKIKEQLESPIVIKEEG